MSRSRLLSSLTPYRPPRILLPFIGCSTIGTLAMQPPRCLMLCTLPGSRKPRVSPTKHWPITSPFLDTLRLTAARAGSSPTRASRGSRTRIKCSLSSKHLVGDSIAHKRIKSSTGGRTVTGNNVRGMVVCPTVVGVSCVEQEAWGRKRKNGHCNRESGNGTSSEDLRIAVRRANRSETPESGGYICELPQDVLCRPRADDDQSRCHPCKRKRALCPRNDHGDGQNLSIRRRRG